MKVVVIGGSGFLGAKTVEALRRFPDVQVEVASRRGPLVVDVGLRESFSALDSADVVVDLSDGTRSRPDALAAWCLESGKTLLEATSDSQTIRRLVDSYRDAKGPGRLVLGGGLFTGVSNLMAREVADAAGAGCSLVWAVASSPFSGAGKGTIALMVDGSARPAVTTVNGKRVEQALARGPVIDFGGTSRPTMRASLAEAEMLPVSTGAANVETLFAFKPGLLVTAFTMLPAFLLAKSWFRALLEAYFTVLRRFALRSVSTSVQMVARAERGGSAFARTVSCADGMEAGAWALAAMADAVGRTPPPPGVSFIDDVVRLEPLLARVDEVAGAPVFTRSKTP